MKAQTKKKEQNLDEFKENNLKNSLRSQQKKKQQSPEDFCIKNLGNVKKSQKTQLLLW